MTDLTTRETAVAKVILLTNDKLVIWSGDEKEDNITYYRQ